MYRRLRALRRVSQIGFLAGFLLLFAFAAYPLKSPIPVDLYLRADPLLALSAMVSLRRLLFPLFWYAVPVVVLSLLLGRVFCGWVCPMGTSIDLMERVFRIRGRRPQGEARWRRVKLYVLIALLVTMIVPAAHRSPAETGLTESVGLSAVYLMDPMALLTRTATWVGLPVVQWVVRMTSDTVTGWSYSDLAGKHPVLDRALAPVQLGLSVVARPASFRLVLLTFLIFAGIVALGRYERRFWCRNLCPLGALLGWLGRLSPVRLAVGETCNRCMRCSAEWISLTTGYDDAARDDEMQLDRRRVLGAMAGGVAAVALPKVSLGSKRSDATERVLKISSLRLIRPPGALAEDEFVTACVRCGECMKVCPTNTLQPAVGEGGLEALGTPVVVPRVGPCTEPCNLCGRVCPTGAIGPFAVEEKRHLYLGTASVNRSACIAWAQEKECLICDEACPYDAISQEAAEGLGRPVVDERICVGCGMCEWICPVEPLGAIRVGSSGDRRHLGRDQQRLLREEGGQDRGDESPYPNL